MTIDDMIAECGEQFRSLEWNGTDWEAWRNQDGYWSAYSGSTPQEAMERMLSAIQKP